MLIEHNHLREYRKRSHLTQDDMAFILGLAKASNVSRFEQSRRKPNIEVLIIYHLLFDLPIESFFERHKAQFAHVIVKRISERIEKLREEKTEPDTSKRITCLSDILSRLTKRSQTL